MEGRREPTHPAAALGTAVHGLLEDYLSKGTSIDKSTQTGGIAHEMLRFLPARGSVQDVEVMLELEVDGVKYRGRVDARPRPNQILDHKTTSNFRYLKDAETLETDLQALIYARWMDLDGELQWTFGLTKGAPQARKVVLPVLRDEVRKRFDEVVTPLGKEVLAAYAENDITSLRQDFNACSKFPPVGCSFRADCAEKKPVNQRLQDKLMALQAKTASNDAPKVDPINPPITKPTTIAPPPPTRPSQPVVVPPSAPVPVEYKSTGTPDTAEVVSTAMPKKGRKKAPPVADVVATMTAIMNESVAAAQPVLSTGSVAVDTVLALAAQHTEAYKKEAADAPAPAKPIQTLYVDCMPLEVQTNLIHAHTLLAAAAAEVCADVQTHHIKLIEFGKGGGHLAAQLEADIRKLEGPVDVVLMSRTPEGRDVLQTLMGLAGSVVMGI